MGLIALLVAVGVSRFLFLPGIPWEQDEALFAAAAFDTNLAEHRPHPPGFPLWVAQAKISLATLGDPVVGLELGSAALSVLGAGLLALAWRRVAGDGAALLGAALFAFLPGVWFHAVRAFSTTPALAFLIAAAAVLWRPGFRAAVAGGVLAGLALGIRPVLLPPAVVLVALALWLRRDGLRTWLAAAAGGAAAVVVPLAVLVGTTGGTGVFLRACAEHLGGHAGALHLASWSPAGLGLVRAAGGLLPALALALLAACGVARAVPNRRGRAAWWLMTAVVGAWLVLAHNRTYPRYTVPLFALVTTPAVAALEGVLGAVAGRAAGAAAVIVAAAVAWPAVWDQAVGPFPPLEALEAVAGEDTTAVVGPGLSPFGDLANLARWGPGRTVMRELVRTGAVDPDRLPGSLAAVWAEPAPRHWIRPPLGFAREFVCGSSAITRLAQGRYLRAWAGSGGAVLLDPPGLVCTADGTPPLRRLRLLVPAVPPHGRLGLVLGVERSTPVEFRVGTRLLGRWTATPPETRGAFHPRGVPALHPWVAEVRADAPVRVRRVWVEDPERGVGPRTVLPAELATGLDGLVWSEGLHGLERFGGGEGRWTGRRAALFLPLGAGRVVLRLLAARPDPARVTLQVPPGPERSVTVGGAWTDVSLPVPSDHRRVVLVTVANPFVPADKDPRSADRRELGVVVGTVRIVTSRRP